MRLRDLLFVLPVLTAAPPALAADTIVPVVFDVHDDDWRDKPLMDAIKQALSRTPSFNLMASPSPDTLVITIPGGLGREGHEAATTYSFTAAFFRHGDKIGESQEGCKAIAVKECADQIAADAQSAAAAGK